MALLEQEAGRDMLLTGQSPLGEVLAVSAVTELDGVAVCLVDVADDSRRSTHLIDTTNRSLMESAREVEEWIGRRRVNRVC